MTTSRFQSTTDFHLPNGISGWGEDDHGVFIQFSLSTGDKYWDYIDQRLRWIPPGTFTMGSPESEPGRDADEGPQHTVTIRQGFWLMDTPVTQQLWQHVMGDNPTRFVNPERPVEQVDWHQAIAFCQKLSGLVKATIQLPTEAQWEYACRAGTETATYAGPMKILGENNAPVLHEIAWYGGNSGWDFDLPNGHNSADWLEKQFEHQQAGTRKVSQKHPNPWGLYDMLGNVWEWCRDGKREYSQLPEEDPVGSTDNGEDRVLRGGSWIYHARFVRSASRRANISDYRRMRATFRLAFDPGGHNGDIGFRCVWAQSL